MASEPFFEERSDAVKMSETPYPTNGSGKNLAKDTRIKYFPLCMQTCTYRLAGSALPGQRRSVSLRFRVAMLLKTQFACHRFRGKLTTKEERNHSFYVSKTSKYGNSTQKSVFVQAYVFHFYRGRAIKKAPLGRLFIISFTRIYISR